MLLSRRTVLLFSALAVLLAAGCSRNSSSENRLRVVDWNVEWFPGGKPDASPEQQAGQMAAAQKAIAELQPDVLLLQEVRDWTAAAELTSVIPGLNVHVASEFDGRPQNQVIAAKVPADSAWSAQWVPGPVDPPRGYAFAALQLPGDRFLLSYSLHLKSNLGDLSQNIAMRRESARQLLAHVKEMLALYRQRGPCAVLVGGDMNTSLDDPKFAAEPTLRAFRFAGFHWTHESIPFAKRTTIPGNDRFPDNCFDHIFTLGLGRQTAATRPFQRISDHYPVVLDLDLTQADFQGDVDIGAAESELSKVPPEMPVTSIAGTLNATDDAAVRAAIGQIATIRGKVSRIGATNSGSITFVDFDGTDRRGFTAIIRKDRFAEVAGPFAGDLNAGIAGKTVEVRGKLELFKDAPQIVISRADQIAVVQK
jgi:endonuclease/exonuclease/phosphatase family metal-dependent hydrolase